MFGIAKVRTYLTSSRIDEIFKVGSVKQSLKDAIKKIKSSFLC